MCNSMTTDSVADRQGKNYCEEWKPGDSKEPEETGKDTGNKFASLFGD